MSAIAVPFLAAMRQQNLPEPVYYEREFVVTYARGDCSCGECQKTKTVRAFSRTDAIGRFSKKYPFAWPLKADPA